MDEPFLPAFSFLLLWEGERVEFSEVSGLDGSTEPTKEETEIDGNRPHFTLAYPQKPSLLTLKRGLAPKNSKLLEWILNCVNATGLPEPRNLKLLLSEMDSVPIMAWQLGNAFPVQMEYQEQQKQQAGGIALERLQLSYEYLQVVGLV